MNSAEQQQRKTNHKRALLIATLLFVSYAYFYAGGGWNQNSRFDLIRAIIEQGTLRIDAYHENTRDKAFFRGHYYSDKAPAWLYLRSPSWPWLGQCYARRVWIQALHAAWWACPMWRLFSRLPCRPHWRRLACFW